MPEVTLRDIVRRYMEYHSDKVSKTFKVTPIIMRLLTNGGMSGFLLQTFTRFGDSAKPKPVSGVTCGYCGKSTTCTCKDYQLMHQANLNTLDEVSYINSLLWLCTDSDKISNDVTFDCGKLDKLVRLSDKHEAGILSAVCTLDWSTVPVINTTIKGNKSGLAKYNTHLGFIRL